MKHWFKPRRLLTQLMLLMSVGLVAAISLQASLSFDDQSRLARTGSDNRIMALASTLAVASFEPVASVQVDVLDNLLLASIDFKELRALRVTDLQGRVLSHFERDARGQVDRIFGDPTFRLTLPSQDMAHIEREVIRDEAHVLVWHPIVSGQIMGWVRVDVNDAALADLRQSIWISTLKAGLLAVAFGLGLVYVFLRQPVSALARARRFAMGLDQSDGAQLPPSSAPLEIRVLESALNAASLKLHQQRQHLDQIIDMLREQEAALISQNLQLDTVFTLSPDGFVMVDAKGRLDYANQAFLTMVGGQAAQFKGLPLVEFEQLLKRLCANPESFAGLAAPPPGAEQAQPLPLRLTLAGPKQRVLELQSRYAQGAGVSSILYLRDITAEVEIDRMKSAFVSHAAHELRTPMTSIYGFSEVLLEMELDEQTRKELIATIHRQTGALIKIINELLDLARIDARGSLDFHLQAVDLADLSRKVAADLGFNPDRWPIRIAQDKRGLQALADPDKLRQALTNVLGNAQKYSPQGGPIEISFVENAGMVGLCVTDHGLGLSAEQLHHIGERFWRADKSGNVPGTGLGVSLTKEILTLHGGHLAIESQAGQGSSFTLWLPQAHHTSA